MKKFILITSCLLLMAGTTALPVMAQDVTAPPAITPPPTVAEAPAPAPPPDGLTPGGWTTHGSITAGGEYFWEDSGSAKFNEYRYNQSEPWGGFGGLNAYTISPDGSHRVDLSIDYRSPEDLDVDLTSQSFGKYKFDFGYQRMGHVFAYGVKSVFDGVGTGNLTLKPGLGLPIPASNPTALQVADANANSVDLLLRRDKLGADLDLDMFWPLDLNLGFTWENRKGDRPFGGSLGFGAPVETAEPIDYDTYNGKAGVEYADSTYFARVNYLHSTFDDHNLALTWENPFTAGLERTSLPPSNTYDNVNGALGVNLPMRTRVLFIGSYAWENQNDSLIGPSANLLRPVGPARQNAECEVESKQFELRATSSPVEKLSLKADFKYFDHINNTPIQAFTAYQYDQSASTAATTSIPEYNSWVSRSAEGEVAYEVLPKTNIGIDYDYTGQTYFYEITGRMTEVENTEKYYIDTRYFDWVTARVSYQHTDRDSNYGDEDIAGGQPPLLRKFDMADLDRNMVDAIVTVMPIDPLEFSLEYNYGRDSYEDSTFGLQLSKFQTATVDADLRIAKWVSVNAYYTYEYNSQSQEDRQAVVTGFPNAGLPLTDTSNPSNWNLRTRSNIHTVGLGTDMQLVPDFINMKAEGTWSKVDGKAIFSSAVGPAAIDANPFVPQNFNNLDSSEFWKAMVQFKVKLTKKIQATLGYQYQKWSVKDYQRDGLMNVQTNAAGNVDLLNMGSFYQPYEVHSVFTSLTYFF